MNWAAMAVVLAAGGMGGSVLYFALRSFVRAELAELRAGIIREMNGTYVRADVSDGLFALVDQRCNNLEAALDATMRRLE